MVKRLILSLVLMLLVACGNSAVKTTATTECTTTNPDRWSTSVSTIVQTNCTSCHKEYSSYAAVANQASAVASEVESGRMPLGSTLSAADKTALVQWAACGAPN